MLCVVALFWSQVRLRFFYIFFMYVSVYMMKN